MRIAQQFGHWTNQDRSRTRQYQGMNQSSENYKLHDHILDDLVRIVRWAPILDLCCSMDGLNSLAPLYFDASQDALRQLEHIQGQDVLCNPPFSLVQDFVQLLEQAYLANHHTRGLLVVPDRFNQGWCQALKRNPVFRLIEIYPHDCPIFSGYDASHPLDRPIFASNNSRILVFELNERPAHDRKIDFARLLRPDYPVVAEMRRLGYL